MKKSSWRKHHKWLGLLFCFFILMFSISGILLNHRTLISHIDISRKWLPTLFQYNQWNNGLLKGTIPLNDPDSTLLIYGNGGVWKSNSNASTIEDFNQGFPRGVDHRNIQGVVQIPNGELFAAGQFELYHRSTTNLWETLPIKTTHRFTDLSIQGDSLLLLSRSELFISTPPYQDFHPIEFQAPYDYHNKVTLFRTVWLIHSGELFGIAGKILVDGLALILILLSVTGILYWLIPKYIKRQKNKYKDIKYSKYLLKSSLNWHDKLGRYTIILTLFLTFTGWCLRPPALIALAKIKVPPIPASQLDSPNPWADKLRAIRYDPHQGDWLLSTSEGFYQLDSLSQQPIALKDTPPVSVMGINVFQKDSLHNWMIGSFSGMYQWDRATHSIIDYYTNKKPESMSAAPFGKKAISGYSQDFKTSPIIVEYDNGTTKLPMPTQLRTLPISLWNLALEVHTGRIYTILGSGTLIYIFFAGLIVGWILITGYKMRRKKR